MYCQRCGTSLASTSAVAVLETDVYAGFWVRFVAMIIDILIVAIGGGIVTSIAHFGGFILSLCGPWLYEAFMLSSEWQATVGKRAMNLAVTGLDGGRISFARATGRHFAKYVSACLLGAGFVIAAFTEKKQALHDIIAGTLVINKPS